MDKPIANSGWTIMKSIKFLFIYGILSLLIQIPLYILEVNSFSFYPIIEILVFLYLLKKLYLEKNNQILVDKIPTIMGVISLVLLVLSYKLIYNNSIALLIEKYIIFDFIDMESVYLQLLNDQVHFFLSVVILAPIVEEIIFREIILNKFLLKYSVKKAIIASSILFSIIHISIFSMINALFLGIIFGYIYYRYKTIILCILLHSVANMIVFLKIFILKTDNTFLLHGNNIVINEYINVILGIIFGIFAIIILNNKKIVRRFQ